MQNPITHLIPLVITDALDDVRRYYGNLPGCRVDIDMEGYVQVEFTVDGAAASPALAFMKPQTDGPMDHPMPRFGGEGLVISVPVQDADAHHLALSQADRAPTGPCSDKPWGWRSFLAHDPCGVALDFFHVKAQPDTAHAAS